MIDFQFILLVAVCGAVGFLYGYVRHLKIAYEGMCNTLREVRILIHEVDAKARENNRDYALVRSFTEKYSSLEKRMDKLEMGFNSWRKIIEEEKSKIPRNIQKPNKRNKK
jgi:hypothetical protein